MACKIMKSATYFADEVEYGIEFCVDLIKCLITPKVIKMQNYSGNQIIKHSA